MITLENKRVHDYIVEKDLLVDEGRKISGQLDILEAKILNFEKQEKEITAKIEVPKDMKDRGDILVKQIADADKELAKIIKEINELKLSCIPAEMKKSHEDLMKQREQLERDRNKVALKVQKIKDKLVPVIQKVVKPMLGEYDDIETAKAKDGKVVISTFNHLTDWKRAFKNKSNR